jgi:tight adherence protein C
VTGPLLSFAAAALAAAAVTLLAGDSVAWARRAATVQARRRRRREGTVAPVAMAVLAAAGRGLAPAARIAAPSDLEARIAAAGLGAGSPGPLAKLDVRDLMAAKLAAAVLGAGAGLLFGSAAPGRLGLALAVAGPIAGFLAPDLWLRRLARERARRVRRELPGMLDLLRVTVDAGLPLTAALTAVGERTRGTLGGEWRAVGREIALGVPLSESMAAMLARVPTPEVGALIAALERASRHGTPLAETLASQARSARASRRRRIREEAARAGPKIQLVVALMLVPSVLLLVAAALATALLDGGGGLAVL